MSEGKAVGRGGPTTISDLAVDLARLGVEPGSTLLVHSSLSALGWVVGGAQAVIEALLRALGPDGTLVMPTFAAGLTDPAHWSNPPVPKEWWQVIRDNMPPYDPAVTPTRMMGAIPELFRTYPGVQRSAHPHHSFAARGPEASGILADHTLEGALGEGSPLARLYDCEAQVLLLGVGHDSNSSLHLAENRAQWPGKSYITQGAPSAEGWLSWRELDLEEDDFATIGAAFPGQVKGTVAAADAMLFNQRGVVDFGVNWMEKNR
jgi:aminoglycoside 3-N-acetyltransferase